MNKVLPGMILWVSMFALGCSSLIMIDASGVSQMVNYNYGGFTKVEIEGTFRATITQGQDFQLTLNVDSNVYDQLQVRQTGNTLYIGLKPGYSYRGNPQMEAVITMPNIEGLNVDGVNQVTFANFDSGASFEARVIGTNSLSGNINCGLMTLYESGTNQVDLQGQGANLNINAMGVSTINLENFISGDTVVDASGTSTVIVHVNGALNATATGMSNI
jgi:hypothetical protein